VQWANVVHVLIAKDHHLKFGHQSGLSEPFDRSPTHFSSIIERGHCQLLKSLDGPW
jgi:hypothetical protein